jgi:hypothetical protein
MLKIPLRPDLTHYDQKIVLDGIECTLEFRWNTRESAWYMHIKTAVGDDIIDSIKVVVSWPLGARSTDTRRPPGFFIATDTSGAQLDPGIADLGDRVSLYYVTAAEAEAAIG